MTDSGTLPRCPLCNGPIARMGKVVPHRFVAEDLGSEEICLDCARKVAPSQVAAAEALERALPDEEPSQ